MPDVSPQPALLERELAVAILEELERQGAALSVAAMTGAGIAGALMEAASERDRELQGDRILSAMRALRQMVNALLEMQSDVAELFRLVDRASDEGAP